MVKLELRICQTCADKLIDRHDAALALQVVLVGQCPHAESMLVTPALGWT
jgi:hypothetical protein